MFKRKSSVRDDFQAAMQSGELAESTKLIRQKKADLHRSTEELNITMKETSALASSLTKKLKGHDKLFRRDQGQTEGMLFVDYRGQVVHANRAACVVLGKEPRDLVNQQIERVLIGEKRTKALILPFSNMVLAAATEKKSKHELAKALVSDQLEATLDSPVLFSFKRDKLSVPLEVRLTLLDTHPTELEDVTYVCYIKLAEANKS